MARLATLLSVSPGVLAALLVGCNGSDDKQQGDSNDSTPWVDTYVQPVDADSDGVTEADGDCNDADATIFTGQVETCDGIDNNCNDLVDEGYPNSDGDATADCQDSEDAANADDCDGLDNDGDGEIDEGFADADGNGVADCQGVEICDGQDNDGDGEVDEGFDGDGDGYTTCGDPVDCNDAEASVNPGAAERDGNGVDDNCDGTIDTARWSEGDLVITEIMYNPQSVIDPYGEWIELYNTTDHDVLANGLTLVSTDGQTLTVMSSATLTIGPGEYFVIGSNGDDAMNGGVDVDYAYTDFTLTNEADDLSLFAGATQLDYIYWDDGATMPVAAGASLMVDPGFYGSDDPNAWCAAIYAWGSSGDKGSPGSLNELCATTDHDLDGYNGLEGDCDDADPTVYPGAWEEGADAPLVDNDCDGDVETAPTAMVSASSSGFACDAVSLYSTGSFDPDGSALTYSWELVAAPASSAKTTADISTPSSANPTFYADVAGTYTFQLTVNDGGTNSLPVTVDVVLTVPSDNNPPVSNAGSDSSLSGTADCTPISYGTGGYDCDTCTSLTASLSASSSYDPDGDEVTYAWAITSGSSYGSLSASTGTSTVLTVSNVVATYGSATTQEVIVTLTVTDCMGTSTSDDVSVVMSCTGY